jgi:hypothetical protein
MAAVQLPPQSGFGPSLVCSAQQSVCDKSWLPAPYAGGTNRKSCSSDIKGYTPVWAIFLAPSTVPVETTVLKTKIKKRKSKKRVAADWDECMACLRQPSSERGGVRSCLCYCRKREGRAGGDERWTHQDSSRLRSSPSFLERWGKNSLS